MLREADRVSSTHRADSAVSRLRRGEIGVEGGPPEVAEVLSPGETAERESDGAFSVLLPGPDGGLVLDPSGVVAGWERPQGPATGGRGWEDGTTTTVQRVPHEERSAL